MSWHCKASGGYDIASQEAYDNCVEIYNLLGGRGWTRNAVIGLLGNIGHEGVYNPWLWQNDDPLNDYDDYHTSAAHAYGLVQFDPASKYIDHAQSYPGYGPKFANTSGSDLDGQAQMLFIDENADYIPTASYPETYSEYKASTKSVEYLTRAWFANYERGTWSDSRLDDANYWDAHLPDAPSPHGELPIWLIIKIRNMNFGL
jgi:hypothetical protein